MRLEQIENKPEKIIVKDFGNGLLMQVNPDVKIIK